MIHLRVLFLLNCITYTYTDTHSNSNSKIGQNEKCVLARNTFLEIWLYSNRMIMLGKSSFLMGSSPKVAIRGDDEAPVRLVKIETPFWIDKKEVSLDQFQKFIQSTKYKTTAEIFGNSFVFWMSDSDLNLEDKNKSMIIQHISRLQMNSKSKIWWWIQKPNVTWSTAYLQNRNYYSSHPVVHVSQIDAQHYCKWIGGRLPTEIEWEYSCRGGNSKDIFPWGNKLKTIDKVTEEKIYMANIWQGQFPYYNTKKDGFALTSPGGNYSPNSFGLYDMIGNIWEWTLDHFRQDQNMKIQKGGSFLCHRNHCFRYRCGARTKGSSDSTASNLGFRCVFS